MLLEEGFLNTEINKPSPAIKDLQIFEHFRMRDKALEQTQIFFIRNWPLQLFLVMAIKPSSFPKGTLFS